MLLPDMPEYCKMSRDKTAEFLALMLVAIVCASIAYILVRYFMYIVLMIIAALMLAFVTSVLQVTVRLIRAFMRKQNNER